MSAARRVSRLTGAAPARVAAWRTLARVRAGATLADAIARERETLTDARDRALAHDLATGVLRWRLALDAAIAASSNRELARLDVEVLDILRLGVYQLRHRDRLPAHAIVSDAVALTRLAARTSAGGFVNAVLRRLSAAAAAPPPDDAALAAQPIDAVATQLAHPAWLAARWAARLGIDAAIAWMRFDNEPAPLTLRALPSAGTREALAERLAATGVSTMPARWAAEGLIVTGGNPLDDTAGGFVVQDEASQVVGAFAAAFPASRRLDVCAAPGGKTLALWAADTGGLVVAGDCRPRRVRLLRETLARAGAGRLPIVQHDAVGPLPYRDVFDLVLVDAPCSGLGTLRREPDLKWRRTEAELPSMADLQRRMLAHAARVVAPGGVLVYATCSSEPDENEAVADGFLAEHGEFAAAGAPPAPPGLASLIDAAGRLYTSPAEHGLEAFFAAAFRRRIRSFDSAASTRRSGLRRRGRRGLGLLDVFVEAQECAHRPDVVEIAPRVVGLGDRRVAPHDVVAVHGPEHRVTPHDVVHPHGGVTPHDVERVDIADAPGRCAVAPHDVGREEGLVVEHGVAPHDVAVPDHPGEPGQRDPIHSRGGRRHRRHPVAAGRGHRVGAARQAQRAQQVHLAGALREARDPVERQRRVPAASP